MTMLKITMPKQNSWRIAHWFKRLLKTVLDPIQLSFLYFQMHLSMYAMLQEVPVVKLYVNYYKFSFIVK
jgi:hypothetical protein